MSFKKDRPDISVVIAVYNGERTLAKTLSSLADQTFKNFEVVLVNDESQDNSERVFADFQKSHPEICFQYTVQKNRGLGGARNTGMRMAHGSVLSLLDQDDIWYSQKLEKVFSVFEKNRYVSFVTHHLYRVVNGNKRDELRCDFMIPDLFSHLLFKENHFCGSAMSFRKEVLEKIGVFSEDRELVDLSEDYDYWLRAAAKGLGFFVLPEVLGEYSVHADNFSKNKLKMYRHEWNVVWKHYRERPTKRWIDPLYLLKKRGKIFARQLLGFVG